MSKNFINTADFSLKEISEIIKLAISYKKGKAGKKLTGKILGLMFFNPSLRTRVSSIVAIKKLGGNSIDFLVGEGGVYPFEFEDKKVMDGTKAEHIKEAAGVISRYCDAIAIRASELVTSDSKSVKVNSWEDLKKDQVISAFAKYSNIPVINLESNVFHPGQGVADAMTIVEKLKKPHSKKLVLTWAYHPKALPMAVPNSQMISACDLGMDVTVVHPDGWDLDDEIVTLAKKRAKSAGGSLKFSNNQEEAMKDAKVVIAKSWGALKYYGNWKKEEAVKNNLKHWIVDSKKMSMTDNAFFMHCLPVRRNVIVTDEVLDSKNSVVIDEAENRVWAHMAIFEKIIGGKK